MSGKYLVLPSLALALATVALAQSGRGEVKLTMDEVPFQPINGLTVKGVTFADTAGATYNTANGGQLDWVQDPTIEGNVTVGEVITITFPYAVNDFQFGFALSTFGSIKEAVSVKLYSDTAGANLIGTFTASSSSLVSFTEGLFVSPSNVGVIGRAVVTFLPGPYAFAIDNLTFSLYNNLYLSLLWAA